MKLSTVVLISAAIAACLLAYDQGYRKGFSRAALMALPLLEQCKEIAHKCESSLPPDRPTTPDFTPDRGGPINM